MNINDKAPKLIIVMGVSGSGKSTVAKQLSNILNFEYIEADDFHSKEAKQWMASGKSLTNEMRVPWVNTMCSALKQKSDCKVSCVLAYSGLVKAHRDKFRLISDNVMFIYLSGSESLIATRLSSRQNHFFSPSLLSSQFASMEPPEIDENDVTLIDISLSLDTTISHCLYNINHNVARTA
jgi:gluconokinase